MGGTISIDNICCAHDNRRAKDFRVPPGRITRRHARTLPFARVRSFAHKRRLVSVHLAVAASGRSGVKMAGSGRRLRNQTRTLKMQHLRLGSRGGRKMGGFVPW